ncbi:MAG TPA: DUF4157 domain-containing protein [Burkholderiales bacterium]|nr:DUF4157 domain-containing protein [Burkholderiales bacterium]
MSNVALRILAASRSRPGAPSAPWLQRRCACGTCAACRQKAQANGARDLAGIPASVHEVLRSPGQALDTATRSFFEARFGHDFGRVRVHADIPAAESANAVAASAYTVGSHVVFGAGRYAPATDAGRRLLAHELTHVVQQGAAGSPSAAPPQHIGPANHPLEHEADVAAEHITSARPSLPLSAAAAPVLQRQATPAQAADDCSGYEADPVSFSLHVARHVAKTFIDPKLASDGEMPVCEAPRGTDTHSTDCEVPFKNGPPILVMWNPRSRRTIGRFDSGGVRKRYVFDYSCPGGVLTLKFVLLHTEPAPGARSPGGGKPGAPQPDAP